MATSNKEQPTDTSLSSLFLVEKVINIFAWMVGAFLVIAVLLTLANIAMSVLQMRFGLPEQPPSEALPRLRAIEASYDQIAGLAREVWSFLRPVLQLVIVIVLLRWLLISPQGRLSERLRGVVADVPSLIAIVVIGTICLLPLLRFEVPDPLANIALVIVGFYFGRQRRLREEAGGEAEGAEQPPAAG